MIRKQRAIETILKPGETLSSLIKSMNYYNATSEEMADLFKLFNQFNPDVKVLKPGMKVIIPVLSRNVKGP